MGSTPNMWQTQGLDQNLAAQCTVRRNRLTISKHSPEVPSKKPRPHAKNVYLENATLRCCGTGDLKGTLSTDAGTAGSSRHQQEWRIKAGSVAPKEPTAAEKAPRDRRSSLSLPPPPASRSSSGASYWQSLTQRQLMSRRRRSLPAANAQGPTWS